MKSYVYETVKFKDGGRLVTKYTVGESLALSIMKFLFFLFILWPLEFFVFWPMVILFKLFLILCEFAIRGIFWLIKLPFCLAFSKNIQNSR